MTLRVLCDPEGKVGLGLLWIWFPAAAAPAEDGAIPGQEINGDVKGRGRTRFDGQNLIHREADKPIELASSAQKSGSISGTQIRVIILQDGVITAIKI